MSPPQPPHDGRREEAAAADISADGLDRWQRLSAQFDAALDALDMPAPAREARLASLRRDDPALADRLQGLLANRAEMDAHEFLVHSLRRPGPSEGSEQAITVDPPQVWEAPRLRSGTSFGPGTGAVTGAGTRSAIASRSGADPFTTGAFDAPSLAGQTVGAYSLISRIGEGGMGTVWLAQRSDGQFEGRAAVKLLKASFVGRTGEERFRREGSILARLAHASIAHLIDAGVSPGGQPYLVLEYVEGEHIDAYCDGRRLDIAARIRLFLDVLTAVAHAHANLVVHRDLKPSNILVVTERSDGTGASSRVKLLDFGVAKLLEQEPDSGVSLLARDSGWALTPAFAAPEQLAGGVITTKTDVYALGVLLYVLLGGRHPMGAALHTPADLIAAVMSTEAPRLCEALAHVDTPDGDTTIVTAARRGTTPERLRRTLEGDLETIVAKALKKSPHERYASVAALADDLRRYLDQRPITARPDTWTYRTTKFVRRNHLAVALSALTLAAVGAGVAGTLTQARRAEVQRQRADEEAHVARAQRDFALDQVSRADDINDLNRFLLSEASVTNAPVRAGDLLAHAEHIVEQRSQTDRNSVEMLISLGSQYAGLGHQEKADALLSRAYERSRALGDAAAGARAACALAPVRAFIGDAAGAERLLDEGLKALPREPQYALHHAYCSLLGSEVAVYSRQGGTAITRALAAREVLRISGLPSPMLEFRISNALANAYSHTGRHREMQAAYADAAQRLSALGRGDTFAAYALYENWGSALLIVGRPLEARPLLQRAYELFSIAGNQTSAQNASILLLRALNDLQRGQDVLARVATVNAVARRIGSDVLAESVLLQEAAAHRQLGHLRRAEQALAELESRVRRKPRAAKVGPTFLAGVASERSMLALARGETASAASLADRAITLLATAMPQRNLLARLLVRRSDIALAARRTADARADAERAIALQLEIAPDIVSGTLGRARLALGRALIAQGQRTEARGQLSAAVDQLMPTFGGDHGDTRLARQLAASIAQ